jgi:hypothetical protein
MSDYSEDDEEGKTGGNGTTSMVLPVFVAPALPTPVATISNSRALFNSNHRDLKLKCIQIIIG